jgi:putative PIN family toxin of toxin-antitoxin system
VRIAVDSSVLIAASISRASVCASLLEDLLTHHELVTSEFILDEVGRKLDEKFRFPPNETKQLRRFLAKVSVVVVPSVVPVHACRDSSDLPILGTAVAGKVTMLVTVDKDLLEVRDYQGIAIIRPGEFWQRSAG